MRRFALAGCMVCLVCLAGNVRADDLDKKVVDIVKEVGALHKAAKSMHVEATIVTTRGEGDNKKEMSIATTIDVERPNRFALRGTGQGENNNNGMSVVCDGKHLFVDSKALKQYTQADAPGDFSDIAQTLLRVLGMPNSGLLFQNVLADDPADQLMDGVTACSYAGKEKIGDTPVHHLKFVQPQFDWELWVAAEGKPFVLKAAAKRTSDDSGEINTVETYKNWKVDEAPAKDAFAFTPPANAKKVEEFERP